MKNKVLSFINKNKMIEHGDSVVLGVSGGADSMCMLHILTELAGMLDLKLHVVHVNHHIRGIKAKEDADYVKKICGDMNVDFSLVDADIPLMVKKTGMTEEEAGRQARYKAFFEMANDIGDAKIAVAHNLNDNSETVLFNLFRGTGIKGLCGIPITRENIIRPLLCCTREEIENYLIENHIEYRTDMTNMETEYSRNKIRLELLPYIKDNINEKADYNIVNAAQNLNEISDYLNKQSIIEYKRYVEDNILKEEGFKLHPAILNKVIRMMIEKQAGQLKDITRTHVLQVTALIENTVSKTVNLPYNLVATRLYHGISIKKMKENNCNSDYKQQECTIFKNGEFFFDDRVNISLENNEFSIENIKEMLYTKWFDYDKIKELTVRTRRAGDYLTVDEKGSTKKLKDYFINQKIPKEERDKILLLADGNHIVWIIGYRISSYYKVNDDTKHILRVEYEL